jgi:2-polyprenyl-3-methyl-5-hydroxy-6-metoxy-1,4-benzoquinol methylase
MKEYVKKKRERDEKEDYLSINNQFWNRKYYAPNVEGFIFRLKPKLLDLYIPPQKKLTVLDYGCGEGSNINYLIKKYNYDGYGVDISRPSITTCRKKINKKKFKLISSKIIKNDKFFDVKFDLIISIQVLYYLNNTDLKLLLANLNSMLKPGGYVFFTMKSIKSDYWRFYSDKKNIDGLAKVDLSSDKNYQKRQKGNIFYHFINFTKNEKDLKNKFKLFKKLNIGYYDGSLESSNESGHHFTFFGKKKHI